MELLNLSRELRANAYPGRGIVLGRCQCGSSAVIAYWIMGRSENSRNRVFTETGDGIMTEAFDPAKLVDPSLIIYHPVRVLDGRTIVTNGDQTDTIWKAMADGVGMAKALESREFEPDAPNYTPRISGVVDNKTGAFEMSILKSSNGDPAQCLRYTFSFPNTRPGEGRFLSTYMGDGNPLPSFEGEPKRVALEGDFDTLAGGIWESLNPDNKVSLFVRFIDLASGETTTKIFNKHQR